MSASRDRFLSSIEGLSDALSLDPISSGANIGASPGTVILRRGMLIAALITLESFIRDRTEEILAGLSKWPASYEQLPQKLRDAALLNSLTHLQRYAIMLKRQQEDYESEIISQVTLMSLNKGPTFGFSKFVSGDFTGNISDEALQSLVANFQISDCWNAYRAFSADIGFGVPSVREILNDIVRKRHRSAHSADFFPTTDDITSLPSKLICLGICFDVSMSCALEQAIHNWKIWSEEKMQWRNLVDIYFADPHGSKFRLKKKESVKALKVIDDVFIAKTLLPKKSKGRVQVVIARSAASIPVEWQIV